MNIDASSVIGGDSVINNNKKTLPMIIGSDVFNSVQSIDASSASALQKQMTISQIGGPMSSSVIQKIPNQSSIPSSSNISNNTTVQMQPIANNPSIPTPPPLAPPSVPSVVPSVPSVPSVPTPPPSVSPVPSVPSVPTPPPQNPSFPPVAMQPNVGGPGVPLPPPLIIPPIKPPQPKPKPSAPPKKKIEIPKERPKTMQELLAEQREKMKKGAAAQKSTPPIQTTEPSQPKAFPFKLPGMKPPIDDTKDDDDKTEAIQVGLHNLKSDTTQQQQQSNTETEEKKPIIQIKKDPRLELTGKRLNDVFGDDEDDNNNNKPEEKKQQQQPVVKQEPPPKTISKPPMGMGIGMRMPGLSNQFKPSPPSTTTNTGGVNSNNNQSESNNKPPVSGFGNKLSNLEKLFTSGFGMGMSMNMAQTQKPSTQRSVIDTEIQVQKSEYENIVSKNNKIIQKKKPKKKVFGVVNDSNANTQLNQQNSSTITQNTKTENKTQLHPPSTIKPESSKLGTKDLFTDTDTTTDTNANTNTSTTNNPPLLAKSSVVKPTKNLYQQKPAANKRLTFLYDDEE